MTAVDLVIKRRRLMKEYPGRFQQNEAAKIAGLNAGTLVDIEREKLDGEAEVYDRIAEAWDRFVNENMTTNREEVMA